MNLSEASRKRNFSLGLCIILCAFGSEPNIISKANTGAGHSTKLAKLTKIDFSDKQLDLLDELTAFNIEARYNDYKFQFYKKATRRYTEEYLRKAKEIYLWLRKKL